MADTCFVSGEHTRWNASLLSYCCNYRKIYYIYILYVLMVKLFYRISHTHTQTNQQIMATLVQLYHFFPSSSFVASINCGNSFIVQFNWSIMTVAKQMILLSMGKTIHSFGMRDWKATIYICRRLRLGSKCFLTRRCYTLQPVKPTIIIIVVFMFNR